MVLERIQVFWCKHKLERNRSKSHTSLSAPIRMTGGSPASDLRLSSTLYKNSFLSVLPDQSSHLSCSMLNENKDGEIMGAEDSGASSEVDTFRMVGKRSGT
jgi:hypothetical protein